MLLQRGVSGVVQRLLLRRGKEKKKYLFDIWQQLGSTHISSSAVKSGILLVNTPVRFPHQTDGLAEWNKIVNNFSKKLNWLSKSFFFQYWVYFFHLFCCGRVSKLFSSFFWRLLDNVMERMEEKNLNNTICSVCDERDYDIVLENCHSRNEDEDK